MSSSRTETLIEVAMPKMGISVSEGTILEWRKQPGDWIEADETIADVTTDKVDVEIPAPASGRLARIIAEPGDTVPVGEPIAEIDAEAKPGEAHPEESAAACARRTCSPTSRQTAATGRRSRHPSCTPSPRTGPRSRSPHRRRPRRPRPSSRRRASSTWRGNAASR